MRAFHGSFAPWKDRIAHQERGETRITIDEFIFVFN